MPSMKFKSVIVSALALMFFPIVLLGQDADQAAVKGGASNKADCYDWSTLLNPAIPLEEKRSHLSAFKADALAGNTNARYVLGAFYRLGEQHPARLVTKDLEQARAFMSNAAVDGDILAMAAMAELELEARNYRAAMLWAQVYAYFSKQQAKSVKLKINFAYQASLLKRIMDVAQKQKVPLFDQDFIADFSDFFKAHGHKIEASTSGKNAEGKRSSVCKYYSDPDIALEEAGLELVKKKKVTVGGEVMAKLPNPGYAFYLLTINPNGDVDDVAIVDSLPDAIYAEALLETAKGMKFNKSDRNSMRQTFLPMTFDDNSVGLKKRRLD